MDIHKNYSLKAHNTFGLDAKAAECLTLSHEWDWWEILEEYDAKDIRILGGGSNLLLTQDVPGLLVKNEIKGIEVVEEEEDSVLVEIGGGENWHDFVMWAISQDYGGVENLALIPGTVGAAPIQNIGAYGVELKDVFEALLAMRLDIQDDVFYGWDECKFAYRDSIFKKKLKGKVSINRVYLRLSKPPHQLDTSYEALQSELNKKDTKTHSIQDVAQAVIHIRQSKLPDPKELGNSGSFFKNPELSAHQYQTLLHQHPDAPAYPLPNGRMKIPAAWLIDQCGFKGIRHGNTGCYQGQPLVLVNYGQATGQEIWAFAQKVQATVQQRFKIDLEPEVNVW